MHHFFSTSGLTLFGTRVPSVIENLTFELRRTRRGIVSGAGHLPTDLEGEYGPVAMSLVVAVRLPHPDRGKLC